VGLPGDIMATVTPPPHSPVNNLPNQLTASRLVLALILFVLIGLAQWIACVVVFAVAAVTDWLDGYYARKHNITSSLGRNLDPLVDKVLICGAYIFLQAVDGSGLVPWMVTLVVARELIITSLRGYLESAGATFGADWLGKIKMVLQCAALFGIFVALQVHASGAEALRGGVDLLRDVLVYAMLAATALSGLQYLWRAALLLRTEPEA
jgi:CDP-diacylglycerol--glycerol-3-phosphate 3-phosphatidyltransferase